jgi:hypothetical protein
MFADPDDAERRHPAGKDADPHARGRMDPAAGRADHGRFRHRAIGRTDPCDGIVHGDQPFEIGRMKQPVRHEFSPLSLNHRTALNQALFIGFRTVGLRARRSMEKPIQATAITFMLHPTGMCGRNFPSAI